MLEVLLYCPYSCYSFALVSLTISNHLLQTYILLTLIHNWLVISAHKFTTFSQYHQKNTRFLYIFDENGIYEDLVLASSKLPQLSDCPLSVWKMARAFSHH